MGAPRVSEFVLAVLERHRGTDVSIRQLTRELREAGHKFDNGQITGSVNRMASRNGLPITTVIKGQVWRYEASNAAKAEAKPETAEKTYELFELVGRKSDGTRIVRDEGQTLYSLTEL